MAGSENALIELWPEGAPYATGVGDEDRPALTTYLVEDSKGAVIVLPGGGYGMRADHEGHPIALWLNGIGISAFVLRYRVAPYSHPSPLLDAQRAIRYVRLHAAEWGIDERKIGILGFSAGGHLASTAATQFDEGDQEAADPIERMSSRPDAAILCYPVITMHSPYTHEGSRENLLGPNPDEAMVARMSSETRVTPNTPPTFIWHTSDDEAVPVENALLFAAALRRAGVPFDLHVYEKGHHGLGLAEGNDHVGTWSTVCGHWLKGYEF